MEIIADSLVKSFKSKVAVSGISFELVGKGCFGYLGPNGVGKTTTLRMLTSLLRPTSGKALIDGFDVMKEPRKALLRVGALIEDPQPYPWMDIGSFIDFAAGMHGIRITKSEIGEIAEKIKLPPLDSRCSTLSKGQKRRVILGALLAQDPDILILDEPSSGLDPAESVIFRNLIIELKKDKLIFLSSHILYEVTQICDYALFLNGGKIVERGSINELANRYKSGEIRVEFDREFDNRILDALKSQSLIVDYIMENKFTFLVEFDGDEIKRKEIVERLYPSGIKNIQDSRLGLEKAYEELIK